MPWFCYAICWTCPLCNLKKSRLNGCNDSMWNLSMALWHRPPQAHWALPGSCRSQSQYSSASSFRGAANQWDKRQRYNLLLSLQPHLRLLSKSRHKPGWGGTRDRHRRLGFYDAESTVPRGAQCEFGHADSLHATVR